MTFIIKHKPVNKMYKVSKMKPKQLKSKKRKSLKTKAPSLLQNRLRLSKKQISFLNEVESSQPQPENTHLIPGLHFLGCGYNIFGSYADESAILERLIDPNKIKQWGTTPQGSKTYAHWPFVKFIKKSKALSQTFSGKNLDSMCKEMTKKAGISGSYCGFQGSVNLDTYKSVSKSYYHEWYRKLSIIQKWQLTLDNPTQIRKFLYPNVAKAINNWEPNKLFKRYGLYFTDGVILGGKFSYTSAIDTYKWASKDEMNLAVKASYFSFVKSSASYTSTTIKNKYESSSEIEIETVGGDNIVGGDSISNSQSYQNWKNSIKDEDITLIDFTDGGGLTGIWELASTHSRRSYLQQKAREYGEKMEDKYGFNPLGGRKLVDYVIKIKTGNSKYDDTDAKVLARLVGIDRLGIRRVGLWENLDTVKNDRERGKTDEHYIDKHEDLGELIQIELYHTEKKDAWVCEWVEIKNKTNGKTYSARVNKKFKHNKSLISLTEE
ncbi:PLAT/LH2 domain-containing protein [Lutibacter oricola]|uniref:PLAT/LH2 domain-containing protein n=1 Tax=Lutibacter oricola TaxID=762486 RepID=A0A1H2R775_9FLAO|nr:PLAT/LH2 domain-containing protein [Lutibacter oricola]SDW15068.1 PLAT/LH2 domain-containing protein [Lutibacter oricola]